MCAKLGKINVDITCLCLAKILCPYNNNYTHNVVSSYAQYLDF